MQLNRYITLPVDWDKFWPQMKANLAAQHEKELGCKSHDFVNDYVEITDNTGMNLELEFELGDMVEIKNLNCLGRRCVHCGRFKPNE